MSFNTPQIWFGSRALLIERSWDWKAADFEWFLLERKADTGDKDEDKGKGESLQKLKQPPWREGSRVAREPQGSYHQLVFFRETFKRSPGRVMYIQTYMITRLDVPPLRNEHSSLPDLKPCILVKLEWSNISQKKLENSQYLVNESNNKILYILKYSKENAALLLHILNKKKRTTNISGQNTTRTKKGKGLEIYVFTAKLEGSCSCFCIIQTAPDF